MVRLTIILFFLSVQSFGQVKELKYTVDSDSNKYTFRALYEKKTMDLEVTFAPADTSLGIPNDTIWTDRVIKLPTNTNAALTMVKTKFIIRKPGRRIFDLYDPQGKAITAGKNVEVKEYESLEYKTFISL